MHIIPHNSQPLQSQSFNYMGENLTLITRWNTRGFWNIDVYDNLKDEWITRGEGLNIGGACLTNVNFPFYIVMLAVDPYTVITREALGDTLNIYLVTREEYHDAIA